MIINKLDKYPLGVYNIDGDKMECNCKKKVRTEDEKKKLISRINIISGQMNGIKKMIEEDRYCGDILIQLSAIDKSIKSLANLILENHMNTCLIENVKNGEYEIINQIIDLFKKFQ